MRSMRFVDIPMHNLRRRKGKTAFLVAGLLVGIATMVAVLSVVEITRQEISRRLDEFGPNIVVTPESIELPLTYSGVAVPSVSSSVIELEESDATKIRRIRSKENINIVAPKLVGLATVDGQRATLVGVLFPEELTLKKWWQVRGEEPSGPNDALLGSHAAERLGKETGSFVEVDGVPLRVAGILEPTGSGEDSAIYADLHTTQAILKKPNRLGVVEVSAWCISCPVERIVEEISAALPNTRVTAVKQALVSKLDMLESLSKFYLALAAVVLLVGSLVVLTTMMSSINERTREIGIFRAGGFRQSHIIKMVMIEALIVSAAAGFGGFVLGTFFAVILARPLAGLDAQLSIDPLLGLEAMGIAIVIGTVATLYPAWKASRLDPASALRAI